MTNPLTILNLETINPPGQNILVGLWGDATYEPAGSSSSGGWQIIDRPRLVAALQWYDRSPMQLTFDASIDSETIFGNSTTSVEAYCLVMDQWQDKVPGTQVPPILSVSGPIPGIQHQWVLQKVSFGAAIRDPNAGFRVQQKVSLTLYEYNATLVASSGLPSPAASAQLQLEIAEAASSYTLYTAGNGDTLLTIAAKLLNNWEDWTVLSTLNSIRDPNSVIPGQVIKIPQF